jgi:hypothetical protein
MLSFVKTPYLQWPTQTSMTIMWETSSEADGAVTWYETRRVHATGTGRFETVEASVRTAREEGAPRCIHRVTLTGLAPGTSYHYRVRSANGRGEVCESDLAPFKTAVETHVPFSFSVTSETGGSGDDLYNRELFELIGQYRPDFLLMVGDAVSNGSRYTDWERYFFGPARPVLSRVPFYLVLGNHEENAPWFYDFVAYPEPKNFYAFQYGNAHFIGLDSTAIVEYRDRRSWLMEGAFEPGAPQYDFLTRELSSSTALWKIVFFHYPPYVSADYQVDEMRVVCPILEEYGVDVVFNSHTILYERSHPIRNDVLDLARGIVYVVAGGAGARPQWFHHTRAWHTAQAIAVPHFVQVSIAGARLELHAIDWQGRLFDHVTMEKKG